MADVMQDFRVMDSQAEAQEERLYQSLRATEWGEFCGQDKAKKALQLAIRAAKQRSEVLDHILLYGPPGLGKTTLAHIIAKEMGVNIRVTSGPALERAGDIAAILTGLEEGDVLFVDEIHRLNRLVEETVYPAMEDFALDVVLGKGPGARSIRLDLPRFTLVGATTQAGKLSGPLRDLFGLTQHLDFYTAENLAEIVKQAAQKLKISIDNDAAILLGQRSRRTARVALKLLKRVRDYAQIEGEGTISVKEVAKALDILGVDDMGLDGADRKLLLAIIEKFQGGPVGLSTLAAVTAEDVGTIEDVYEPFLMQMGLMARTNRGRVVTPKTYSYFGLPLHQEK